MMQNRNYSPDSSRTVLTIAVGFLVIYFITGWQWTAIASLVIGLVGVVSKKVGETIHWFWMKLAWLLGLIIPKIVLTLIFFIVLLPVALLSRVFRKDQPVLLINQKKSMFRDVNKTFGKNDFLNPW